MVRRIGNCELTSADVPPADASVGELLEFAHSYDGYEECGSFERCAEVARQKQQNTLGNARACLFFEARRWRHFGEDPDAEAMVYWRALVEAIRRFVEQSSEEQ